jgi:hypothetical protein
MISQKDLKSKLIYDAESGVFKWKIKPCRNVFSGDVAGMIGSNGYRKIGINGRVYSAHRLAFLYMNGILPSNEVDHIDHNRDNNSWQNLREATRQANSMNLSVQKRSVSGHPGVTWSKRAKKWIVRPKKNGRKVYLGYYSDLENAINVCKEWHNSSGFHANHGSIA